LAPEMTAVTGKIRGDTIFKGPTMEHGLLN